MTEDLALLVGRVVERIRYDEPQQWVFTLSDQAALSVACPWQIVAGGHLSLASGDHGQVYGLPTPIDAVERAATLLTGRRISRVVVDPASADLAMELEGAVSFRTFNDSSGFEPWNVACPQGTIVAQGNGNVVVFPTK